VVAFHTRLEMGGTQLWESVQVAVMQMGSMTRGKHRDVIELLGREYSRESKYRPRH